MNQAILHQVSAGLTLTDVGHLREAGELNYVDVPPK